MCMSRLQTLGFCGYVFRHCLTQEGWEPGRNGLEMKMNPTTTHRGTVLGHGTESDHLCMLSRLPVHFILDHLYSADNFSNQLCVCPFTWVALQPKGSPVSDRL